jgi:hypothetical protein
VRIDGLADRVAPPPEAGWALQVQLEIVHVELAAELALSAGRPVSVETLVEVGRDYG